MSWIPFLTTPLLLVSVLSQRVVCRLSVYNVLQVCPVSLKLFPVVSTMHLQPPHVMYSTHI